MLPDPGASFEREYGCLEREWLAWMPAATQGHPWERTGEASLRVRIGNGALDLDWQVLPPRAIALVRLPRLAVRFRFGGLDDAERRAFLRGFDMRLQRGGG